MTEPRPSEGDREVTGPKMQIQGGLEPVRVLPRRILSPLRLPIPPHEQVIP